MPDWTVRRLAHESQRGPQAATASHSHILLRLPIRKFFLFFPAIYNTTYCTFTCTNNKFCVKWVSANHTEFFCSPKCCRGTWLSTKCCRGIRLSCFAQQSQAVQYPIGAHVQVWCWQDISAGQCICSCPSSETLSAPTLHYHNALGSVKRPAVIWKGNYLLWKLLRQK